MIAILPGNTCFQTETYIPVASHSCDFETLFQAVLMDLHLVALKNRTWSFYGNEKQLQKWSLSNVNKCNISYTNKRKYLWTFMHLWWIQYLLLFRVCHLFFTTLFLSFFLIQNHSSTDLTSVLLSWLYNSVAHSNILS